MLLPYYVLVAFTCSIAIAAFTGLVRFRRIAKEYRPFVYMIWLAFVNEMLSILLIEVYRTNVYNSNVYVLLEVYFLVWLFSRWGRVQRPKLFYFVLAIGLTVIWVMDNFIIHPFAQFNSIYRVSSAVILVFLAIDHINLTILTESRRIITNASFLIAVAILLYYSLKGVVEVFYLFQIRLSDNFYNTLISSLSITNLLTNLLYATALLWIPQKQRFSLPY